MYAHQEPNSIKVLCGLTGFKEKSSTFCLMIGVAGLSALIVNGFTLQKYHKESINNKLKSYEQR